LKKYVTDDWGRLSSNDDSKLSVCIALHLYVIPMAGVVFKNVKNLAFFLSSSSAPDFLSLAF
jgi:hypothetical protein